MAVTFPANFSLTNLQRRLEPGIVYVCGSCRLPIGDHNDWSSDHVGDNVILMKAVSQFVKSGKLTTSSDPGDAGSQYQPLSCNSCHNVLGKFYSSTPANLNYKLNLYNIDKNVIDRYKF
ncbi:hypothetical protein GDO81_008339 [Engystomops pustulosus]|uniref:Protein yippee-like n=2 Tax=Engystomops pustulosus TaxID=76066 RepID=A0AAV7CDX7_ENGPU|nr:hypothetical protein GDO81_008339 [Engystomops pustulosus]KAG8583250.1 hypothetical protein GDO81_008339 [Engystomops pustulosus]